MAVSSLGKRKNSYIEWLGWYGVAATVLAYVFVSFSFLPPTSLVYQLLNFTGAVGVTIETYVNRDYQPFWLNLIWAGIALVAIGSLLYHA